MSETADLVVVGAGIAGASTAFFAAERGLRAVVVEQGLPASGASGRTAGYVRCHYANPQEAHFAYESWKIHARWRDIVGGDNGYRRTGFLFIVPPALVPSLEKNVELMKAMGVPTGILDPGGIKALLPYMEVEGIGAAAWEPESGHADPSDCIGSLLAGVRRRGGRVLVDGGPARLLTTGGQIAGVQVGGERIGAPTVLLAAGAGTPGAGRAGRRGPARLPDAHRGRTAARAAGPRVRPLHDRPRRREWYRGETGDALVIGAGYEDSIGFTGEPFHGKAAFAPPTRDELVAAATRLLPRIPGLDRASPGRTWVGLDSRTPDGHALAGPLAALPGLHVLTGGNGKGFKFGPSMGRTLADVLAGAPFDGSPLAAFSVDRYATGHEIRGEYEYAWGSFA